MTVRGNALVVHSRNGPVNLIFLLILGAFLVRITGAVIVLARKGRHPAKDEPDSSQTGIITLLNLPLVRI